MGFSIPGVDLVKKGVSGAVHTAKHVVSDAKDTAVGVAKDGVHLSGEALEAGAKANQWVNQQKLNFGKGVVEWGKSTVGTVVGLASHPVETAKGLEKLANNPILNPSGGLLNAAIHGKDPIEAYKEGGDQLKGIGTGLVNDYKTQYEKNGVAGVAGYVAPDLLTAVLSGGGSAAAKGGATAAARGVAGAVVEQSTLKSVAKDTGKEVAKELAPDAQTLTDGARKEQDNNQPDQNWLEALVGNFSF